MQRGACEALWTGTPIVTSRWPLLQEYFSAGAVHVGNTAPEIRDGVREVARDHARYVAEIRALAAERRGGWEATARSLAEMVGQRRWPGRAEVS